MPGPFSESGAARLAGAACDAIEALAASLADQPTDRAGIRLHGIAPLAALLDGHGRIGAQIVPFGGAGARPVRAILFDKSEHRNWALAWHQDRTICVRTRHDVPGFGPWTVKAGLVHVAPPFDLIERLITIRIHLDHVPEDNAPLLIAPGSHRLGMVREDAIEKAVAACGAYACLADAGDIWVYATPILHASAAAVTPRRRRVLQVDYAAFDLPGGLIWSGI
ncbi:phytanoyl-CoA dioxygenase family protein [Sphingomonas sp.]|uniref:phytanoyl-CoA dioxygenase family protein n=1 Tax=Sphingomonas sp. TaxID=28214 RepID=UPI003BAAD029